MTCPLMHHSPDATFTLKGLIFGYFKSVSAWLCVFTKVIGCKVMNSAMLSEWQCKELRCFYYGLQKKRQRKRKWTWEVWTWAKEKGRLKMNNILCKENITTFEYNKLNLVFWGEEGRQFFMGWQCLRVCWGVVVVVVYDCWWWAEWIPK